MALLHSFAPLMSVITSHTHTKVLVKKFKTEKVLIFVTLWNTLVHCNIQQLLEATEERGKTGKEKQ